jgi:hypothetical protein
MLRPPPKVSRTMLRCSGSSHRGVMVGSPLVEGNAPADAFAGKPGRGNEEVRKDAIADRERVPPSTESGRPGEAAG